MDQPGKVANPARGQLNRENEHSPVPVRAWEFGLARRVQLSRPASACSSPYSGWIWCLLTGFLPSSAAASIMKPPYAIGSVPSLSGHAIAYRWRSLPRVRRHRASKPQGSSERVLPWQITMDQIVFASLSHTHYWYEVGMLKVPAERRWMRNPVWPSSCVTPAGTSNELDVQNEWEENTHTHTLFTPNPCDYSARGLPVFREI